MVITGFVALQETVSMLRRKQQEEGDTSALQLPAALLEEKNLEIDHLNQQILHLQQELDTTKENKVMVYSFIQEKYWFLIFINDCGFL